MQDDPPLDDTAICPACDGSGFGVADTMCGYCGGCGGVPLAAAQRLISERRKADR
jgi:hypothetical protein